MATGEELTDPGHVAVLASALGEVRQQLTAISTEQAHQRDLLTRFDERQLGWATKRELAKMDTDLRLEFAPVAAQARSAHDRLDAQVTATNELGVKIDRLSDKVDKLDTDHLTQTATVQGGAAVASVVAKWVFGIAASVAAGFLLAVLIHTP